MARPSNGTREKLIDTAMDLIWTSSYGAVSVDDICKYAGVKKGSFYHFFPSKQDLAVTALEEHFRADVEPGMIAAFASNLPFHEQIEAFVDSILENKRNSLKKYGRVCGCPMAALGSEMIGEDEQVILAKVEEMFGECRQYLQTAIKAAMEDGAIPRSDLNEKTREIHDFITGLMMMSRIHNSLDGLERDLKPGMMRILGIETTRPILKNYK